MSLPAETFGAILDVQMISAAGDALGTAKIDGNRATVSFSSVAGGVGRVNGLPVAIVTATVLVSAAIGPAPVNITLTDPWRDAAGTDLMVEAEPKSLTVGGQLSIEHMVPVSETRYRITGTGFSPEVRVESAGLPLTVVTATAASIEVMLSGPVELTGHLIRAVNPDSEFADFAYVLETAHSTGSSSLRVFVPLRPQSMIDLGRSLSPLAGANGASLENPHPVPVDLSVEGLSMTGFQSVRKTITLPPGGRITTQGIEAFGVPFRGSGGLTASLPVRAALISTPTNLPGVSQDILVSEAKPFKPFQFAADALNFDNQSLVFLYRPGEALPEAGSVSIGIYPVFEPVPLTVTSDATWLVATAPAVYTLPTAINVRVQPDSLPPGDYRGTVTVAFQVPGSVPKSFGVRLVILEPHAIGLSIPTPISSALNGPPIDESFSFWPLTGPEPITVTVETDGGLNWLSLTGQPGTTANPVRLRINPAGLPAGSYRGRIVAKGPVNTQTVPLLLNVMAIPKTSVGLEPASVTLTRTAADPNAIGAMLVQISAGGTLADAVPTTDDGVPWLSVARISDIAFRVIADSRMLAAGDYSGSVKVTTLNGTEPRILPVRMHVFPAGYSGIETNPTTLSLTGSSAVFDLYRTGEPVSVQVTVLTQPSGCRLSAGVNPPGVTPARITLACMGPPGKYRAVLRAIVGVESVDLPVELTIPPMTYAGATGPPTITLVTHGASNQLSPVAPGAAMTIHGIGVSRRIIFDELPATILSESLFQANVVAPAGIAGRSTVTIRVNADGVAEATVPVVANAPGIFTLDGSGRGQGAILNQDNTVNGVQAPAAPGSVIQIFATGLQSGAPVRVTIGDRDASILYAGPVAVGLFQINALVPGVPANSAAEVRLRVGDVGSPDGATLAIR